MLYFCYLESYKIKLYQILPKTTLMYFNAYRSIHATNFTEFKLSFKKCRIYGCRDKLRGVLQTDFTKNAAVVHLQETFEACVDKSLCPKRHNLKSPAVSYRS